MGATPRQFKDSAYELVARVAKAMAAPKRLELLDLLCQGPRNVESLAEQTALTVANASQHLKVLRAARLVEAHKRGLYVEYRLASDEVCAFVVGMRDLAQARIAELALAVQSFAKERDSIEPISAEELRRRARRGEITVLDVRPEAEFRAGHVPQAVSIPITELKVRLHELQRDREVIAYCRGPYCVMALDAVEFLRKKGFAARRMEHGVAEFRARGFRVETSAQGVA